MTTRSLSVVVITVEGAARLRCCLESLREQDPAPLEILAPWDESHREISGLQREFPAVQFPQAGSARMTYAQLRAFAVARSQGEIIAVTEDHFRPAPDWCRQIVEAHRAPHAAIGGGVEKDAPDTALHWAFYFADYLRYLDPREGLAAGLTDGNVTYKRAALEEIAGVWQAEFHENLVHHALMARGGVLWITPRIVVRQKRAVGFAAGLRDRYAFGRLFGATRVAGRGTAVRTRLALGCALLPALLVTRVIRHVLRTRRYGGALVRAFPALLLLSAVWAWGELAGYLTGTPEASLTAENR
jgi:Glycosyl transferase family 2